MLSHHQHRWLQWLEGVLDDPSNGGYEVETRRAEAVAEINRRDFLGLNGEVVPTYRLSYAVVDPDGDPPPDGWGWRLHGGSGQLVYSDETACASGCWGMGRFDGLSLEELPCDQAGLQEVIERIAEAFEPDLVQIVWEGVIGDASRGGDPEEEWIENEGLPAEYRETERRLQAVLDNLPDSIPDVRRPCDRPGCEGTYVLEYRDGRPDVHLDMDGSANAGLVCDRGCGYSSCHYWCWDPAPGQEAGSNV
jgi:hypothetical protein